MFVCTMLDKSIWKKEDDFVYLCVFSLIKICVKIYFNILYDKHSKNIGRHLTVMLYASFTISTLGYKKSICT